MSRAVQPESWHDPTELKTTYKMRWFFPIFIALWIPAAIIATVVAFCITKNPNSFYLFTSLLPPSAILFWITKYLFRDNRDFQLKALEIEKRQSLSSKETFNTGEILKAIPLSNQLLGDRSEPGTY